MANIIGIERHRMGSDGHGITTLVGFHGCPLACKYCLNPQCRKTDAKCLQLNTRKLYELLKRDELYFLATHGGVTFGGGEPCLHSDFIEEFRSLCGEEWTINVETSLNVSPRYVEKLYHIVDAFYVDIKDMNPDIYFNYTGSDNNKVYENLKTLADYCNRNTIHPKVIIRTPLIPGYNTETDVSNSVICLKGMGFEKFNHFTYNTEYGKRKAEM